MIDHLDHLVLTTTDAGRAIDFYTRVLGMQLERFGVSGLPVVDLLRQIDVVEVEVGHSNGSSSSSISSTRSL
jgi:catechol 2,3-dioxygenase-like lactoylglutathione lyase family enzyme